MTTGQRIAELRQKHSMSQPMLAEKMNVSASTITSWENDRRGVKGDDLVRLSQLFNVSTDYLLGNIEKANYYSLSGKEKLDIAEQAQRIIDGLDSDTGVNFYGEPATDEQKQSMRDILEMGLRINKEKAKKKFTPKKYRNTEDKDSE
ncbi:helix-turn-helix domain-containing protein [Lacticaseibacillus daqingensis]|uniref:helix-turn-helix domain-containing protein n=1 Tax=Lacticaseibacillus daqingensis TaxID=2486014 RepID=UPI000F7AB0E9|nr:helix-turn-helix domain-containing protein [Lacticaseibacillus daqingensis]